MRSSFGIGLMGGMASIRTAIQEDAPSIARVQIETWRATYREIVPAAYLTGLNEEDRTIRWREHLNSSEHVLVAERDGREGVRVAVKQREIGGASLPVAAYGWSWLKSLIRSLG